MKLDELAALNEARTQGDWYYDGVSSDVCVEANGIFVVCPEVEERDARAIVAAVNAMGPMLRVVRAARVLRDAETAEETARAAWAARHDPPTPALRIYELLDAYNRAHAVAVAARAELDAALREVET